MSGYNNVSTKLAKVIVSLYQSGLDTTSVAEQAGCCQGTVYAALHQENIELQRQNYKKMVVKHISYADVNPIWAAEFRGFFYGDGYAGLNEFYSKEHKVPMYKPKLGISLRVDSLPLLKDVQAHIGGSVDQTKGYINSFGYQSNPVARWYTCSYSNIMAIIRDVLLPGALLPATKRVQIELLYEALLARLEMPYNLGVEGRAILHSYSAHIKELKHYKGSSG